MSTEATRFEDEMDNYDEMGQRLRDREVIDFTLDPEATKVEIEQLRKAIRMIFEYRCNLDVKVLFAYMPDGNLRLVLQEKL